MKQKQQGLLGSVYSLIVNYSLVELLSIYYYTQVKLSFKSEYRSSKPIWNTSENI
jgi:hypothetical protein